MHLFRLCHALTIFAVPAVLAAPDEPVRLSGTPEEIGQRHGELLAAEIQIVVREYIEESFTWRFNRDKMLARVRQMKPSLPEWYRRELSACAEAAEVDEDMLLYAQCEGDIRSLHVCTTYVAFGDAAAGTSMEIGRSFDYWGLDSTDTAAVILAVIPDAADGYAFVSVGWAGILGGWTFINEKGLFVGNNMGGGTAKNPLGIPTLIMTRIIAQKAATVDQAIALVKAYPRMRGQVLVVGQAGDPEAGIEPAGAVIEYDAEAVEVRMHRGGFAFDSSFGRDADDIRRILQDAERDPEDAVFSVGNHITLHSVAIRPHQHAIWVAHGRSPSAHYGGYAKYDLRELLKR